jgi:hypothetical protein
VLCYTHVEERRGEPVVCVLIAYGGAPILVGPSVSPSLLGVCRAVEEDEKGVHVI